MTESEFSEIADQTLARIERAVEDCGADVDVELKEGGVLELEFADGSRIIVNRHNAAREIWVAARSGGYHFRYADGRWRNHISAPTRRTPIELPYFCLHKKKTLYDTLHSIALS
nr:MAG: iron donor protein CyaY [Pseudomonadota bacterium]